MQEFFDKAQLLLVADKADQSHIVELCLLCVHCLEVRLTVAHTRVLTVFGNGCFEDFN